MTPQRLATVKPYFYWPLCIPAILAYLFMPEAHKKKLLMDTARFWFHIKGNQKKSKFYQFYWLLCGIKEYRNVFYMRVGYPSLLFSFLLPPMIELNFATPSRNLGGGIMIQHGWTTVIDAASVGENLWINQNVTIGHGGKGHPTIGNNVRIGSGAVIIGDITIGDNVNIGANAIVVDNVPANTTVCSPKAVVVKYHKEPTPNALMAEKAYQNAGK